MTTDYTQIIYEVQDRILTITLNRPDKLNAFTPVMCGELIDAFGRADREDEVRAIIVTGAGRAFCAGADLSGGGQTFDFEASGRSKDLETHRDGGGRVSLAIFNSRKPVIAAINGPAVGVGITMTLPMDIRIAKAGAKIGFVFSRRGIVPEACSTYFLPRLVGIGKAVEWIYSGRVFKAEEALAGRLVGELCDTGEAVVARAREVAREIVENTSGMSVALARQMLWRMLGASHPMEAHRVESRGIFTMGASLDSAEGVSSFLEKRPPNFTMSVANDMPDWYPWWDEPEF